MAFAANIWEGMRKEEGKSVLLIASLFYHIQILI